MKKVLLRSSLLLGLVISLHSCQKEVLPETPQALNEAERVVEQSRDDGYSPIPEKFYGDPEAYVKQMLKETGGTKEVSDPDCIWIDDDGYAHLYPDPDCKIDSNIPEKKGCDKVYVGVIDCYIWWDNPDCLFCEIFVVVECDDGLYWKKDWILDC